MNTLRSTALIMFIVAMDERLAAQLSCLSDFSTPAGQTAVANTSWTAANVPLGTTTMLDVNTTAGSNSAVLDGGGVSLVCTTIAGPNVPAGTIVVSTSGSMITLSSPAIVSGSATHTFTLPAYAMNYPPPDAGLPSCANCSVCPALFSTTMCAGEYFSYHMCEGNAYTISMCSTATDWNSYLNITTTTGSNYAPGFDPTDDDGCGVTGGHASLTFIPTTTGTYRVRLWADPCLVDAGLCGTIDVACTVLPVGIEEQHSDEPTFSLLPNPASDRLILFSPHLHGSLIRITDLSGRTVLTSTARSDHEGLDISPLATGTYVVHIVDVRGRHCGQMFVKQ